MKKILCLLMVLVSSMSVFGQESVTNPSRMDRSRLNIGVYHLRPYARTEAHVKDLADCGIDFVICMDNDRTTLDLFSKYGVGAIVSGIVPGWWGGDGDNAGKLSQANPLSKYEEAAASFKDHPAIWGIDIGDEPSALDFPYYGKVYEKVKELFPNQFPFINLYPNYASVSQNTAEQTKSQLGTATYAEHIQKYCENVPADYLSYDFYYKNVGVALDYSNLRIVSDACRKTGRGMWVTVQVNSYEPKVWITENELRFQAYSALAFGAENITWACYTAGWWTNQVLDGNGVKTQQYDKLKKVNAELHSIGKDYMRYASESTTFVGFEGTDMLEGTGEKSVKKYNDSVFKDLSAGCPLVVGEMVARDGCGNKALFVCVADDPFDKAPKTRTLRFKAPGREVSVKGAEGYLPLRRDAEGWYECKVSSCQGVLIEAAIDPSAKKLIVFDLDGTLTEPRSPMGPASKAVLDALKKRYEVIMAGGGNCKRIYGQMGNYPITILGNYGMEESRIVDGEFKIVREETSPVDRKFFEENTSEMRKKYGYTDFKGESNEYHQSGMVTFALLGTKADHADKMVFDPDKKKRREMFPEMCERFKDYSVFIGGTTSFDITPKQYNKYDAVMRYAGEHGYTKDQILFVGDDFDDGGNDSQIRLGGMDYIRVYDYKKLPQMLRFLMSTSPAPELPMAVAHRGCWLKAGDEFYINENCPAGVKMAAQFGYPAIECDVKYTLDSVMVIMHDGSINRTMRNASDYSKIEKPVKVTETTFEELRTKYVLESTDPSLRTPIPTLEEELAACKEYGVMPMLHSAVVESYKLAHEMLGDNFVAFDVSQEALAHARDYSSCLILLDPGKDPADRTIERLKELGGKCGMSTMKHDMLDAEYIKAVKDAGFDVQASIFQAPHEQRAVSDEVTIQLSDFWWHQTEGRRPVDTFKKESMKLSEGQSLEWNPKAPEFAAVTLALDFEGTVEVTLGGRTYKLTHEGPGKVEVFGTRLYKAAPGLSVKALTNSRVKSLTAELYDCGK